MTHIHSSAALSLSVVASVLACDTSTGHLAAAGMGGTPGVGGASQTGDGGQTNSGSEGGNSQQGGDFAASGGTTAGVVGGQTSVESGGSAVNGGASSSGGTAGTNGLTVGSGGVTPPFGGTPTISGGTTSAGGRANTGGTAPMGGKGATGGVSATGGKAAGGTSTATGGTTTSAGGGTSTGPCQQASCGTHKWACWKVPTPVSEKLPNPQSYRDLGNGAIQDDVTCLSWEKANPSTQGSWQASVDRCAGLASSSYAGFNDWRLPTRIEMASITDVTLGSTGYPKVFSVTSGYYTTASFWYETILYAKDTTVGNELDKVWGYGTNGFTSNAISQASGLVARCVRGNGTGEPADEYAVEPANHYTISNGEVTDNYTGLIWQQGLSPSLLDHASAITYCASLDLNGHTGWRLPALNELASTVNEAKVGGAIVASAFPNNPSGCKEPKYWFWAAEAYGSNFWGLSYCDGFTGYNVGASGDWNYFPTANVRCVR
jgi:hypothetical protein